MHNEYKAAFRFLVLEIVQVIWGNFYF